MELNIGQKEKIIFDHVKIRDTGSLIPVVFEIEEGYGRGGLVKSEEGEYVVLIGVSNIKTKETMMNYEKQENEKIIPVYGMTIHNKKEAEVMSEFFKFVAKNIEGQETGETHEHPERNVPDREAGDGVPGGDDPVLDGPAME